MTTTEILQAPLKQIEFMDCLITATPDVEGYGYQIEQRDPWGNLHLWKESEDLYPTEEDALAAGKEYVDNFDPSPEESPFGEQESFVDAMYRIQRLK